MGYEFFCGIPVAVLMVLALVVGLFIQLERLEDWAAKAKRFGALDRTKNSHWWNWRNKGHDTKPLE